MEKNVCGFCGAEESYDNPIIVGDKCMICSNCVISAYTILFGEAHEDDVNEDVEILKEIRKH